MSTEAVEKAYEILTLLSPNFVDIYNGFHFDLDRMSPHAACSSKIACTFEERNLGNRGTKTYWKLPNGTMVVDSMYYVDKYPRNDWTSISLATVARELGLPPKLDADEMMIKRSDSYDVSSMLTYHIRDADLHMWVIEELQGALQVLRARGQVEIIALGRHRRFDGPHDFCEGSSVAMSMNMCLDLSTTSGADDRDFERDFVLEPKPGCYKGKGRCGHRRELIVRLDHVQGGDLHRPLLIVADCS